MKPVNRIATGKALYKAALCNGCHGNNAYGVGSRLLNGGIPDLRYVPKDVHEQWLGVLMGAALDKGMPSYAGQLKVDDCDQECAAQKLELSSIQPFAA